MISIRVTNYGNLLDLECNYIKTQRTKEIIKLRDNISTQKINLSRFLIFQALGGVSADLNPAITLSCMITGKIPVVKALMYILMQCLGALAGTSLLKVNNSPPLLCRFELQTF